MALRYFPPAVLPESLFCQYSWFFLLEGCSVTCVLCNKTCNNYWGNFFCQLQTQSDRALHFVCLRSAACFVVILWWNMWCNKECGCLCCQAIPHLDFWQGLPVRIKVILPAIPAWSSPSIFIMSLLCIKCAMSIFLIHLQNRMQLVYCSMGITFYGLHLSYCASSWSWEMMICWLELRASVLFLGVDRIFLSTYMGNAWSYISSTHKNCTCESMDEFSLQPWPWVLR